MPQFGRDVIALLDHLGLEQAVVGGTSLGANVALEAAVAAPERVRALVLEMPVLENGIAAAVAVFMPLALALRVSQPVMRLVAALTRRIRAPTFCSISSSISSAGTRPRRSPYSTDSRSAGSRRPSPSAAACRSPPS